MGDVAMTVPVLRALLAQYPTLKITVLSQKFFTPFFRGLSNVSVCEADLKGKHKGVFGLYRLSRELKKLDIDFVCDLHNVLRTVVLKFLLFGKKFVQIDKGRKEKKQLISGQVFEQLKTTHQRYADVFDQLGFAVDLSNPTFEPKAELPATLKSLIDFSEDKRLIGIAPFAAHQGKRYNLDQMEIVIQELANKHRIILFGGGKREAEMLKAMEAKHYNVRSVAGKISLAEELDVISNLDVMLAMDSGNAHIAAMFGVNTMTIWNVTHPYAGFYPFHQPIENALLADRNVYPKIPTSIYGNKYPKGYEYAASKTVTPEMIVAKILEKLDSL